MICNLEDIIHQVRYNVSTNRTPPFFEIRGLPPGVSYRIDLYAVNAKGRSDVATIETVTLKGQAKFTGKFLFGTGFPHPINTIISSEPFEISR